MMNKERILLVDDQPSAAEASILAISHFIPIENILHVSTAAQAIKTLDGEPLSLVFLDIDMPDTNGFSLAAYIEAHRKGLPYVFLTGYADFAAKSYDYEPLDFLTKPIDLVRLHKTFDRFRRRPSSPVVGKIAIHTKQDYIFIDPQEILYIAREKRKNLIHCRDGQVQPVASSLDELEVIFSDYGFFRCHQSFLIPLGQISSLRASDFGQTYEALIGGTVIPVSRSKYLALKEALSSQGVRFM